MPAPDPTETVRLLFEARVAGDHRRVYRLVHPEYVGTSPSGRTVRGLDGVRAYLEAEERGRRTEVMAHRIEACGDEVVAYGRLRIVDGGSLADSPAAWRFRVRDGAVLAMAPERS